MSRDASAAHGSARALDCPRFQDIAGLLPSGLFAVWTRTLSASSLGPHRVKIGLVNATACFARFTHIQLFQRAFSKRA